MKSFYTEHGERYTREARDFTTECNIHGLGSIIEKWSAMGYSIREMQTLLIGEVFDMTTMAVITLGTRDVPRGNHKAKKEEPK